MPEPCSVVVLLPVIRVADRLHEEHLIASYKRSVSNKILNLILTVSAFYQECVDLFLI
jgi:hypothetical protein